MAQNNENNNAEAPNRQREQVKKNNQRQDRPRFLKEDVAELDFSILQLLMKRYNLLQKMRRHGHLEPADEKFIRENWQSTASRLSRDPELSGRFFTLMQGLEFLPKPQKNLPDAKDIQKRDAFNLRPAPFPVQIKTTAPVANWPVLAWLYLGAASGMPVRVSPTTQANEIVNFTRALMHLGAAISRLHETVPGRQYEVIATRAAEPLGRPDEVIHAGDSHLTLYIFLAHYLGRPSRIKFMGDSGLKMADLAPLRQALPALGARLTHIIPKSSGLPIRVECSAILPQGYDFPHDLPAAFGQALILAAPFYEKPFAINFEAHPEREEIFAKTLPIMEASGAIFSLDNYSINLEPCILTLPITPDLPVEASIASFLLALTEPLRGTATLEGSWPDWPKEQEFWLLAETMNLPWKRNAREMESASKTTLSNFVVSQPLAGRFSKIPTWGVPFFTALAACSALANGKATLTPEVANLNEVTDFLRACKLKVDPAGAIISDPDLTSTPIWAAPTPEWALALALAACAKNNKQGLRLANPGIMTELWPSFWQFYNSLPKPTPKAVPARPEPEKQRRRILTNVVSEPPEIKEEDWD